MFKSDVAMSSLEKIYYKRLGKIFYQFDRSMYV